MAPIDWSDRITQLNKGISGIPQDLKFKIVETKTGLVQEVEAHRMVLAMASDVFHTMFYGSGNMYQDVKEGEVLIKDTTKEAFEIMIGAVYTTVSMEESLTFPHLFSYLSSEGTTFSSSCFSTDFKLCVTKSSIPPVP